MSWHRGLNATASSRSTREFNPGPATTSRRRLNFYGHFRRAAFKPWQQKRRLT